MQIIYASCTCSEERFLELTRLEGTIPEQQVQKYHRLLQEGLAICGVDVVAITAPPVSRGLHPLIIRLAPDQSRNVHYRYLPIINIPVIRPIAVLGLSFYETAKQLLQYSDAIVVSDVLNFSVATGALLAAKTFRRVSMGIVTDLPQHLTTQPGGVVNRLIRAFMHQYDSFLLLTSEMSKLVNRRGVPQIVMEGHVDDKMRRTDTSHIIKHTPRVCLYAGRIDKRYGIQNLVEGFVRADIGLARLHVYGGGDYETELRSICESNPQIKYFGVVANDTVLNEQYRASLLVNPRPTNEEFVKHSFPSKNMEYLVSGTPTLTTLLPGMPAEYLPYVFPLEDESADGIARALESILRMSDDALAAKGLRAKEFVLAQKSNVAQAQRLIDFIFQLLGGAKHCPPGETP